VHTENPSLIFDVPDGSLSFAPGDLDTWAEHLTWCYRMMGVADGATIAVQDFGSSALSFLGSSLLMPGMARGVAERLGGRVVGLDASSERVALTPGLLSQLGADVLVVRATVADLLYEMMQRADRGLNKVTARTIISFRDDEPLPARAAGWRYLLHIESALILAPECPACGRFHLRTGFYATKGNEVRNLRLGSAQPYRFESARILSSGRCHAGPNDRYISFPVRGGE
jgi:hypothetical protein